MFRRLALAVILSSLLFATPALAGLTITDRQTASTELVTGPQFYAFGSGTDVVVGAPTDWAGFDIDGLQIDPTSGQLVLGRAGETAPSDVPWHDGESTTRACEAEPAQSVRSLIFDAAAEIEVGRLRADLADIRVFDAAAGTAVPFRTGSPEPTSVVVDTTDASAAVCVYWGNPNASSASDASVRGPVVADGGWSWSIWEDAGDGTSLDLVDWSAASASGSVATARVPADVCNQCANELVGFVTPEVSGSYQFFLSADDVGRLELGPGQPLPVEEPPAEEPPAEDPPAEDPPAEEPPAEDPPAEDPPAEDPPAEDPPAEEPPAEDPPAEETPAPVFDAETLDVLVELDTATTAGDASDPAQASVTLDLEAGMAYPIRARSKDLEFGDHLEIFWAIGGDAPSIITSEFLLDVDAEAGTLTHRRFDVVATTDRSGEPSSTQRIEASETPVNSCVNCAHSISGFVVVDEAGTYRFWVSSDDEGELLVSTSGNPAAATRVAWLTNFTSPDNYTADPSQRSAAVELAAGQVIWLEAFSRDRGGPDHLQVAWSRDDVEPATAPALIPSDQLSENPPVEGPLPTAALDATEGQQSATGSFSSGPIDTTAGGSNIFGRLLMLAEGDVDVEVSFAPSPEGPWSAGVVLEAGQPAPLDVDGLRYVRFAGSLNAVEGGDPSITSLGVERDLVEATSIDATTTVEATANGDQAVLRVSGSIGAPGTAQVSSTTSTGAFSLESVDGPNQSEVSFGASSHHVVVSPVPGASTATGRWSVTDGSGVTVIHDITVALTGS